LVWLLESVLGAEIGSDAEVGSGVRTGSVARVGSGAGTGSVAGIGSDNGTAGYNAFLGTPTENTHSAMVIAVTIVCVGIFCLFF
jgi:hypothetical protein